MLTPALTCPAAPALPHSAKTDKTIMSKNMKKVDTILRDMVILTLRTELTRTQRTNLETCITVHMHQKESTEDLLKKKIKDPTDFEWLKQVRGGASGQVEGVRSWGHRGEPMTRSSLSHPALALPSLGALLLARGPRHHHHLHLRRRL